LKKSNICVNIEISVDRLQQAPLLNFSEFDLGNFQQHIILLSFSTI